MIILALAVYAIPGKAQISITKSDYPFKPGLDIFHVDYDGSKWSLPEEGANKTYDYAHLVKDETFNEQNLDGSKNSSFPDATIKEKTLYNIAGFEYRVHRYYAVTDKSFYGVGRTQFDSTHSLATVTGVSTDQIHYPQADLEYPNKRDYMKFPMTYGDSWEETETEVTQFELTIAAFGLNKTPGTAIKHQSSAREVVGYGKLIIPDDDGKASAGIDVLLVKIIETSVDSVFLGGAPAPKALLDAFNFTQGRTTVLRAYTFEMIGLGRQALTITFDEMGIAEDAVFRPRAAAVATGSNDIVQNISIYPSTLRPGDILNVQLPSQDVIASLQLVNLQGVSISLQNIGPGKYLVPQHLAPGMYVYEAKNQEATRMASGKLLVTH